ncbi:MAG: hypothetical protein KDI02_21870 [Anaerolineae bacterium]|nr:hypothetical protein [Anaerolineae bacterium]MCB0226355.1 hypothetical protein [Anaerolineae bacterium]MCB9108567.1 hypothetical protein [Anaerolineales bacterium]
MRSKSITFELITQVIKLWETGQITVEQAIGKILLWLRTHDRRLTKLEAQHPSPNLSQ